MTGLIVAIVVIALVAAAIWAAKHAKNPEQTASHTDEMADTTSDRFYGTDDRPAGPEAEDPVGPADPRDPATAVQPPP